MPDRKSAKGRKKAPQGRPVESETAETATSAGIDDPEVQARLDKERAKIEEAQARIAQLTGGRKSRTGSAAGFSKGSARVSVTHSVHVAAAVEPTTYLDPITGTLKVIPTKPPPLQGGNTLLGSLPDGPNLPGGGLQEVIDVSDDTADDPASRKDPGGGAVEHEEEAERSKDSSGSDDEAAEEPKKLSEPVAKQPVHLRTPGRLSAREKSLEYLKLLLRSVEHNVYYEIFVTGANDYEAGDFITVRSRQGNERLAEIVQIEKGKPGPKDATGIVDQSSSGGGKAEAQGRKKQEEQLQEEQPRRTRAQAVAAAAARRVKGTDQEEAGPSGMEQPRPSAVQKKRPSGTEKAGPSGADKPGPSAGKKTRQSDTEKADKGAAAEKTGATGRDKDGESDSDQERPSKERPKGKKKQAPKQTHPAGTAPGYATQHQGLEDELQDYADLDAAAAARGIDLEEEMGEEPAGLRRIWEWDEDMVKRARQLAKEVANMPEDETIATRGQIKIRELEGLLHSKTGTQPKAVPEMGDAEKAIHDNKVTGYETDRDLAVMTARNARVAAKAGLCNTRGIQLCIQKTNLHTHTLALLLQYLEGQKRILTRYDMPPMKQDEIRANPNLNPLLSGFIPIDNQLSAEEFFSSEERSYELHRWVLSKITWDPSNFVSRLCDLVATREYRIKYSYPGKQKMSNLTYMPERMATFLFGVAETASIKFGGFNPSKVEEQLRVAFQASVVRKRNRAETDESASRKKTRRARKRGGAFASSSSDDDDGEEAGESDEQQEEARYAEDFHDTLVDYQSYLATEDEDVNVEETRAE